MMIVVMMMEFMEFDFNITKIVLACLVEAGTGAAVHTNRPSHGLALFPGGERYMVFDGKKKIKVPPNSIVYFPKGSNYVVHTKEEADCYAINFDMPEQTQFEPFAIRVKNTNLYLESFKNAQKLWLKKEIGHIMKVKSELYTILYTLQNEYAGLYIKSGTVKIKAALDYIHSNYTTETISVTALAELCGMSETYLRKIFIHTLGVTPNKYIKTLKLQRAQELLLSGMYSVTDVCFLAGFNDESYFSREFKKHFHLPPHAYVKAFQK